MKVGTRIASLFKGRQIYYSCRSQPAPHGAKRCRLSISRTPDPAPLRFAYYDADGNALDAWPPSRGKVNPEALPALVGLVRDDNGVDRPLLAAVLGPLEPPKRLYGDEQLE